MSRIKPTNMHDFIPSLMTGRTVKDNHEISPDELKKKIDDKEDIFILDVRTPQEYKAWKLSYEKHDEPKLIPVDRLFTQDPNLLKDIPRDKEIVTICAHGNRSMIAANMLNQLGYHVRSMKGGMAGWNKVYDIAEIPVINSAPFKILQVRRVSKGCIGYIISSNKGATAAVIDPSREIYESYLNVAKDRGLSITNIIDTHQHADHVSGAAILANTPKDQSNSNKPIVYISSIEEYDITDNGLNLHFVKDGDEIEVGERVLLKAMHTPGHTDGSFCYLLDANFDHLDEDEDKGKISYLFTGDTLFVDGVGRPDLREDAKNSAGRLYDTYYHRIAMLPDNTVVLPAHFNLSTIALKHSVPIFSTIGSLKEKIKIFGTEKHEFISNITEGLPPRPMNYKTIISINKKMLPYDEGQMPDLEAGPNSCAISS
jgi:glyoxylase-like metal-dependent hydrolase (beta-lactamase superfamily II)/rhodanese-related sulfurtransferase